MVSKFEAYTLFGVSPEVSEDELKRAYRKALRESHPDHGGTAEHFARVQEAWEALNDPDSQPTGSSRVPRREGGARPSAPRSARAKSHGHPGGWFRERYGLLVREWLGRGVEVDNVFDPALVERAPSDIRHILKAAIAEEDTAKDLTELGPAFEVWHDVLVEGSRDQGAQKIDHVVLGPSLLWALQSEDWGRPVTVQKGDLSSEGMAPKERPMKELSQMVKKLQRGLGVKFSAIGYVVADDHTSAPVLPVGSRGRLPAELIARSTLVEHLSNDLAGGSTSLVGDDLFPLRQRLRAGIRFV